MCRATSSTTRRNRARSRSRTCGPARVPIRSPYLVTNARFVACHQFEFVDKIDLLEHAAPGAVFLLNAPGDRGRVWDRLPREMQEQMIEKKIRFFAIDAVSVAKATGMGSGSTRSCRPAISRSRACCRREEAIRQIKKAIEKTYGKRGAEVVRRNFEAVDSALAHLHEVPVPAAATATRARPPLVSPGAPDFVQKVTAVMMAGKGDLLPVSAFPSTARGRWERRNGRSATSPSRSRSGIPTICIQCNQCALVCPHAAIRAKVYDPRRSPALRRRSNPLPTRGSSSKARRLRFRLRPRIARAAACA